MSAVLEAREPSALYLEAVQPALVRQFELLTTAEGGVTRLRELILTLAVQGKLVPQCPGEAPASEILARARAAAAEQRRERRRSASSDIEPLEPEEGSPALPLGWEWCRGADLYSVVRGVTYQKADASDSPRDDYLPILRANNIRTSINLDGLVYVPGGLVSDEQLLRSGDFVVCLASGSKNLVGKAAMFTGETVCSFGAFCGAIRLAVPLPFFSAFLASPLYREAVAEASSGIGINNLKSSTLLGLAIALPPEAEQARIVARVDELMRLCDALEAKAQLEAEQHARLLGTLLGTLTDSSTPEELAANWQRVADHFDLLLDRPEAVDALEQTILQLAVRGLLVQQDPSDESASELVRRIRGYRDEQVKSGLAKRERPFTPLSEADLPLELPTGWEWIRFDDLIEPAKPISYGVLVPGPDIDRGVPFVRIADLSLTDPPVKPEKSISAEVDAQYQRTRLEGGEILMGVVGSIGKLGVAPPSWAGANIARAICRIVPVGLVDYGFVLLLLQSQFMRDSFAGDTRTLAQPTLNVGLIRSSATPLPPIAEQARIVARVTELRRLCTALRQCLVASQTTQSHLAEALVDATVA